MIEPVRRVVRIGSERSSRFGASRFSPLAASRYLSSGATLQAAITANTTRELIDRPILISRAIARTTEDNIGGVGTGRDNSEDIPVDVVAVGTYELRRGVADVAAGEQNIHPD